MKSRFLIAVLVVATLFTGYTNETHASGPAEIIAQTNPPETAYEQVSYLTFGRFGSDAAGIALRPPVINESGDVMFFASLGGPVGGSDTGLYISTISGVKRQVLRRFLTIPGYSPGTSLESFTSSLFTRNADAVMKLNLTGPNVNIVVNPDGIYRSTPTSFIELERSGSPAPQTNPVAIFKPFSGTIPSTYEPLLVKNQDSDIVAIPVDVATPNTYHGIWMPEISNPLRVMASYPAPGISNTTLSTIEMMKFTDGPAIYRGILSGTGVQTLTFGSASIVNDEAIWKDLGGTAPILVARKGQTMSNGNPSVVLSSIFNTLNRLPFGASDGSVLFAGSIINGSTGANLGNALWRETNGTFEEIFKTGQPISNAPGLTANLIVGDEINQTILDCDGTATFLGSLAGPGVTYLNEMALMQETSTGPAVIARARSQAAGVPDGVIYTSTSLKNKRVCGGNGDFAFTAQVQGTGVSSANDRGVWYVQNGQSQLVFREGMQINDVAIAEIKNSGDSLQVSGSGRVIVNADVVFASSPFGARYSSVLSWAPCGVPEVLVRISSPVMLETGLSPSVINFQFGTKNAMNDAGEVVLALKFASIGANDEKVVKFPPVDCNPPCPADFDGNGSAEVADIFAFLSAWFAGSASADFDENGQVQVNDIFAFLSAWFAGC
jgi:hypothetical protein